VPRRERAPAEEGARARPVWSGSLSFGLVTVPVELYAAQRDARVHLRMLSAEGAPLARRYVSSKSGKPLDAGEIVRGYEVAKGRFVVVTDEELEALAPRRSRDIDVSRFVPRAAIDPAWFVRAYYLVPAGEHTKAYRLLAEILEDGERAALATFVMRERAYAVAIFADGGVLRAETLRFADELRTPESLGLPKPGKVEAARLRRAKKALAGLEKAALDPRELRDDEPEKLLAFARAKRKRGEGVVEVPSEEEDAGAEVVDLMALLKERLGQKRAPRAPRRRPASRRRR
jgi:DNA end-binding protein Ku